MFSQPPDEAQPSKIQNNPRRRRKKKSSNKSHFKKRKQSRFADSMSSWAESFTVAATWQLKHQIAYWKSKAMALEYENRILHDLIRKNCVRNGSLPINNKGDEIPINSESDNELCDHHMDDGDENNDFEVSEEFLQFLKENAKYKEDARQERERIKAKLEADENDIAVMEAGPSEVKEDTEGTYKELYGKNWRRISALETSLQSKLINDCDRLKPMLWPNIPFNFNFN